MISSLNIPKSRQYVYSIVTVIIVAAVCHTFINKIDYRIVAFILLLFVSIIATLFDIYPVLVAAVLSALTWNFFFIPPFYTFHIDSTEDAVLFLMYFLIVLINGVLTYKIRLFEKNEMHKEEKSNTIKLYNTVLNSLSHELRTPIATIIGATDLLLTNEDKLSGLHKKELIQEVSKASFRLNQQVENLLNMSRLESGIIKPKKDWCDMNELIYNTVRKFEGNELTHTITVNIATDFPCVRIDKGLMEQSLYNLIHNAIGHTSMECEIRVSAFYAGHNLSIIVEDNGKGFPENEIANVFNKFYRISGSKTGGIGLGLSIIKGFVEAQGGTIKLENKNTGGAKFTIELFVDTAQLHSD